MNIIEIGAFDGGNTNMFFNNANIWSFEPNPIYAERLRLNFGHKKNITIIEKAVSDYNGKSNFNIAMDGASSSLYELSDYALHNTKIKYINEIIVDVVRMDTFLNDNNINVVDYLYCDAQGNDLTILKSFGNRLNDIRYGKVEVSLKTDLYKDTCNTLNDTIQFLNDNGFQITNLDTIHKIINGHDTNIEFYNKSNKTII